MLSRYVLALTTMGFALVAAQNICGRNLRPCPYDSRCIPNSPECKDLVFCRGTCRFKNQYMSCGGKRVNPVSCEPGTECRDDPRLPQSCGLACDAPGICIPKTLPQCGGFAGQACPQGLYCYMTPKDGCNPEHGGADCSGVCL